MSTTTPREPDMIGRALEERNWIADPDRESEVGPALHSAKTLGRVVLALELVIAFAMVNALTVFATMVGGLLDGHVEFQGIVWAGVFVLVAFVAYVLTNDQLHVEERLYFTGAREDGLFIHGDVLGWLNIVSASDEGRWAAAKILAELEDKLYADVVAEAMSEREVEDLVRWQTERALDALFEREL